MRKLTSGNMLKLIGLSALTCFSACKQSPGQMTYEEWTQAKKERKERIAAQKENPFIKQAPAAEPQSQGVVLEILEVAPALESAPQEVKVDEPISQSSETQASLPIGSEDADLVENSAPTPQEDLMVEVDSMQEEGEIADDDEEETIASDQVTPINDENVLAAAEKKQKNEPAQEPQPLPSARGCKVEMGPTLMAEFTYWRVFEDQLTIAVSQTSSTSFTSLQIKPNFEPGFRVGFGYNLAYDDWDVKGIYAWYQATKTLHGQNGSFNIVIDGTGSGFGGILATNFNSHWKFHYNVLDLELGRNFFISQYITMRPFASVRGAWIEQKIATNSVGSYTIFDEATEEFEVLSGSSNLHQKLNYWGVGPRFGVNSDWMFGKCGVSIFFNASGTLLYSGYNSKFKKNDVVGGTPFNLYFSNVFHRVRANVELFAGFDYGHCFVKQELDFHVYAGYMLNYWWSLNEFVTGATFFPSGDLGLQGLNVGVEFEF